MLGLVLIAVIVALIGAVASVRRWWQWWNRRPAWGPPTPLSPRQHFQIRRRDRWARLRGWQWWPAAVSRRWRERRLTLRRGYSIAVLADFDEYFDRIAADALRYHLPPPGDNNHASLRVKFEDLIDRLEAPSPQPTSAEHDAMATWRPLSTIAPGYESFPRTQRMHRLTECPPTARAALASWHDRTQDWADRRLHARHEVIGLLDRLWT